MNLKYVEKRFSRESQLIIGQAEIIIEEYAEQGFTLTLRQLYYQFVARDIIPNTIQSYKRLGSIINDARLAGLISWVAIEDRTRNLQTLPHWESPIEIMAAVIKQYRIDKWANQDNRLEVWIEKEALVGVVAGVCNKYQVPYFACRGYNSQSEQWAAGQRFLEYADHAQNVIILHLGDHDPSGIDMTRDNEERLDMFSFGSVEVVRLALNWEQVQKYNPPPNPAKTTDSRYAGYIRKYGLESWELDALEPKILVDLIETNILKYRNEDKWAESLATEYKHITKLNSAMCKM